MTAWTIFQSGESSPEHARYLSTDAL
ncbi:uncharacterized protein FTOL_13627 [Fusarium torulosum]|uniref:Uncharacterized protein n=1 Tax=Fusarium torulosum TaxID=33205 RepID=A0AAE8MM38_9HYPO|nr:uncharacterized protein FTOL_13627 [Fusarium torulosum]